jgi:glycosyltransferase involved in cell wall biosynthesis
MRIGIDARSVTPSPGGIGIVTGDLVREFAQQEIAASFSLFAGGVSAAEFADLGERWRVEPTGAGMLDAHWDQLRLPGWITALDLDLYHGTCFTLPLASEVKRVVTVHDVSFRTVPALVPRTLRDFLETWTRESVAVADATLTVSQASAKEISREYGIPQERLRVIYPGPRTAFRQMTPGDEDLDRVRSSYRLPENFILMVGPHGIKKNTSYALSSYELACRAGVKHVPLVLTGGWVGNTKDSGPFLSGRNSGLVAHLGYVPVEDLPALYNLATVVLFPSLHEGFGLPAVEAMACGKSPIVGKLEVMDEICGAGASTVDLSTPESGAREIERHLRDADYRRQRGKTACDRASEFSSARWAAETWDVYAEVLAT